MRGDDVGIVVRRFVADTVASPRTKPPTSLIVFGAPAFGVIMGVLAARSRAKQERSGAGETSDQQQGPR